MSSSESESKTSSIATTTVIPQETSSSAAAASSSSSQQQQQQQQQKPWTEEETQAVRDNYKKVSALVEAAFEERKAVAKSNNTSEKETSSSVVVGAEHPVRLVAVSKTKPIEALQAAYESGCRTFGENFVHELVSKAPVLPKDIEWRMIGHLQSNKVNELIKSCPRLHCIETVDSVKLATKLNNAIEKVFGNEKERGGENPLLVFIQVNTSGEESKSGVEPDGQELIDIALHIKNNCKYLKFAGLMTIGMPDFTSRPENFECLQKCRKRVGDALSIEDPAASLELSMGMSGDFANAIKMGSTNVRIGSTIFGARFYPPKTTTTT